MRHLPTLLGFVITSALIWSPGGLIHHSQRKTNPEAIPAIAHVVCIAQPHRCP
jgi:hypothetical protein